MLIRSIFWIAALTTYGCSSSDARRHESEKLSFDTLVMHRGGCYGRCPVYTVEVTSEGEVTFRGEKFVALVGEHNGSARVTELSRLNRVLLDTEFFSVKQSDLDACAVQVTDRATVDILVVDGERNHRVSYYYGCETAVGLGVDPLSKIVDEVAGTRRWVTSGAL